MMRNLDLDRSLLTHPFIEPRKTKVFGSQEVVGGRGIKIKLSDGRELIDGLSGLWNINVGHGRQEMAEAANKQMKKLPYYPSAFEYTTEPSIKLAQKLSKLLPKKSGINRFTFGLTGSDANETAFRLARMYHTVRGEGKRKKIISRKYSYHGFTKAALSATRIPLYHLWEQPDPNLYFEVPPYDLDELEDLIIREGPKTISVFIVEPIMANGGVHIPPKDYLKVARRICDKYGVLMVFDEVITAFGRTGKWFCMEHFDCYPDFISLSKGLTSGYLPLSATGISSKVWNEIEDKTPPGLIFANALTTGNHATSCAVALANIEIIEKENLVNNSKEQGKYLLNQLKKQFKNNSMVKEIRGLGLMAGINWKNNRDAPKNYMGRKKILANRRYADEYSIHFVAQCLKRGLIVRPVGPNTVIAPPLCTSKKEVDEIVSIMVESSKVT
jgi:adenosylmethionine-8-amino-7-oxononanoate aminotransferase